MSNVATSAPSDDMESFAAMFEDSLTRKEMRVGEVITGEVVRVDMNFVVINAGLKRDAREGPRLVGHLWTLFGDVTAPGVLDVLSYAGSLADEERALLARAVVDLFEEIGG